MAKFVAMNGGEKRIGSQIEINFFFFFSMELFFASIDSALRVWPR